MNETWQTRHVTDNPYRDLPSVDVLATALDSSLPRRLKVAAARATLDDAREKLARGDQVDIEQAFADVIATMERAAVKRVINASGVLLHTNLGRAPWSERAIAAATIVAAGYSNVEMDLSTGERVSRGQYVERLLIELTGAEAALVVNNNAAALLLALGTIARDQAVPVARGELIEIGGSYRLPDVMRAGGARLIEVGTTNRTRVGDYQTAVQTHDCGALLKVHPSNYRVEGFTEEATIPQLAKLAADSGLPLVYDVGSGLLDSTATWLPDWLRQEPAARESLEDGADLVMFSGDKLLGGPQAGIIVGTAELVSRMRRGPLARALRVDGVTYAALGATLESYLDGTPIDIPFWRHALAPLGDVEVRSRLLAANIGGQHEPGESRVGAGSAPGMVVPTSLVRVEGKHVFFDRLLRAETPILARRDAGDLVIDLRSVDPADDAVVAAAVAECR